MHQKPDYGQTDVYDFILPFGGHLDENNRWVILRKSIDWKVIHEVYEKNFDHREDGEPGSLSRDCLWGTLHPAKTCSYGQGTCGADQRKPIYAVLHWLQRIHHGKAV